MNCRTAESLLTKYLKHQLSLKELDEFLGHIESCEACRDELKTYFTVDRAVQLLDLDDAGPEDPDFDRLFAEDLKRSRRYLMNQMFLRFLVFFSGSVVILALLITLVMFLL